MMLHVTAIYDAATWSFLPGFAGLFHLNTGHLS
jgi:hypothetical protein